VQTVVVLVILVLATLLAFAGARGNVDDREDQELGQRTADVSSLISTALGEIRASLGVLGGLSDGVDEPEEWVAAARPLVTGQVKLVAELTPRDGGFGVAVSTGDALSAGEAVTGERAVLAERARTADGLVGAVLHEPDGEVRVAYGLASPSRGRVVVREAAITPGNPTFTVRGQAFSDINVVVYATPDESASSLIRTTTTALPLTGRVERQVVAIGADQWLLVTSARQSLIGTSTEALPWIVLGGGLVIAVALAAFVESLARRPAYALALVDQRTAELQEALRERVRLEEQERGARQDAEAANRSKSEFLSRMSHELRTPLNAVLGFAQLMEMDDLSDEHREGVEQILKGGRHLLDLINEVLDITRIETGTITLSPEPVMPQEILDASLELVRPLAAERSVNLVGATSEACELHVLADRQRLKQILLNLLSNAVKYNRAGGTVALTCRAQPDRLRIEVSDTGPGIRPEQMGLLFTPFERLGAEHTEIDGIGIGLALSRRLAEAMGGELGVDSALGAGSTFWVELPRAEAPVDRYVRLDQPHQPDATVDEVPPARRQYLLHIEDNLSNLRLVERLLDRRGDVELVAAMQGRLGVELARQHRPVMVLLDLHLPDVDGAEVLRQLRDDPLTASIPVVIVSADATPGLTQRLLAAGARAFLPKPVEVPALLRLLDEVLGDDDAT
jgi:signal transduction histidine kinase/CheY-like chemotaxis protein